MCIIDRDSKEVQIIDKETNEDVTNQYLLQIISDYEIKKGASIPKDILTEIIKSYSDASKNFMPEILSQTFNFMKENQEKFLNELLTNFITINAALLSVGLSSIMFGYIFLEKFKPLKFELFEWYPSPQIIFEFYRHHFALSVNLQIFVLYLCIFF